MANPPAAPKSNIEFLTIDLPKSPNDDPTLLDTVGEPKVLDCTIPYGLLPSFYMICLNLMQQLHRGCGPQLYQFRGETYYKHQHLDLF